jgi:hypothetical protein
MVFMMLFSVSVNAATWPKTFSGQPDFDFTREEVIKELKGKQKELGFKPYIANLEDIMITESIDPFTPKPRYRQIPLVGEGVTRNPFLPAQLLENENLNSTGEEAITTPEKSLLNLPDFELIATDISAHIGEANSATTAPFLDLTEFETYLDKLAAELSKPATELDLATVDLAPEVQELNIQSIVTSPLKYAIVNGRRYKVGESIPLTLKIPVVSTPVDHALIAELPNESQLDAETYAAYKAVYEKIIAKHSTKKEELIEKNVQAYIKNIERRTIILVIFGKEYEIKWRLML